MAYYYKKPSIIGILAVTLIALFISGIFWWVATHSNYLDNKFAVLAMVFVPLILIGYKLQKKIPELTENGIKIGSLIITPEHVKKILWKKKIVRDRNNPLLYQLTIFTNKSSKYVIEGFNDETEEMILKMKKLGYPEVERIYLEKTLPYKIIKTLYIVLLLITLALIVLKFVL